MSSVVKIFLAAPNISPVTLTKDCPVPAEFPKARPRRADLPPMVNSISSTQASLANEAVKAAAPKPQPQQTQKSSPQPSDTVTLKSTGGNVDHDGDSH